MFVSAVATIALRRMTRRNHPANRARARAQAQAQAQVQAPTIVNGYRLRDDQHSMARRCVDVARAHGAAVLKAPAGLGKSLVAASAARALTTATTLRIDVFASRRLADENYAMFDLKFENRLMTASRMGLARGTHVGMTMTSLTASLHSEGGDSLIESWMRGLGATRLLLVVDECHQLTARNTTRHCLALDRHRRGAWDVVVLGLSATPEAPGGLRDASVLPTNLAHLYGVAQLPTIVVTQTEEERAAWNLLRWQGLPRNETFEESHVLEVDDVADLHDLVLLTALFTTPTSDGTYDRTGTDLQRWTVGARGNRALVGAATREILEAGNRRRARRKNHADVILLTVEEEERLEVDALDRCVEIDGTCYIPMPDIEWSARRRQRSVRARLECEINRAEVNARLLGRFTAAAVTTSRVGICNFEPMHKHIGQMHRVLGIDDFRITSVHNEDAHAGCLIVYAPTPSGLAQLRARCADPGETCVDWHDLADDNPNTVNRRTEEMLVRSRRGERLQVGVIPRESTVGTNRFGRNVHGVVVAGGALDDTRKAHLAGRIARMVRPRVDDVYATTPSLAHARSRLMSALQTRMEHRGAIPTPTGEYARLLARIADREDRAAYLTLFDPATNAPFRLDPNRDLAHDFVAALADREVYMSERADHVEHASLETFEPRRAESVRWDERLGSLTKRMDDLSRDDADARLVTRERKRAREEEDGEGAE